MKLFGMMIPKGPWNKKDIELLSFVTADRREKCIRYYFDTDKRLSLYSALLLKMKLHQLTGMPMKEMVFFYSQYGKPALQFQKPVYFNFSHSKDFILCGIDTEKELGVDTQIMEIPPFEIMKDYFHYEEYQAVIKADLKKRQEIFYKIWTRKEAYYKYVGTGLFYNIKECNTVALQKASFFHTWQVENYMCSVYSSNVNFPKMEMISYEEIWEYYKNMS